MKTFAFAVLAIALAPAARAQEEQTRQWPEAEQIAGRSDLHRASQVIGHNLQSADGQEVGEIKDLVVDRSKGKVVCVVVSHEELENELGCLPPNALTLQTDQDDPDSIETIRLSGSTEITSAPTIPEENWEDRIDADLVRRVEQQSGRGFGQQREPRDPQHERELGTERREIEGETAAQKHLRASELLGKDLMNENDEDIGEVDDLMVNFRNGRVEFAIAGIGGFLGIGEEDRAIPWQALRLDHENRFQLAANEDRVRESPKYDAREARNPQWIVEVYEFYAIPYEGDPGVSQQQKAGGQQTARLDLNLESGKTYRFEVEPRRMSTARTETPESEEEIARARELEGRLTYVLDVEEKSGDQTRLNVKVEKEGEEVESCPVTISRDGSFRAENQGEPQRAGSKTLSHLACIIGASLHGKTLRAGETYQLSHEKGSMSKPQQPEDTQQRESSGQPFSPSGTDTLQKIALKFKGTSSRAGTQVAEFDIVPAGMKSQKGQTERERLQEPRRESSQHESTGQQSRNLGTASYSMQDGLVHELRMEPSEPGAESLRIRRQSR